MVTPGEKRNDLVVKSRYLLPTPPKHAAQGRRLRQLLAARGMKSIELARLMEVDEGTVSKWLSGRQDPTDQNVRRLSEILETTVSYIRNEPGPSRVVPLDESGLPVLDEIEQLREWIPDDMARRMSRSVTPRVWLGMLYALGAEEGWPDDLLERIHAARKRLDDETKSGGEEGPGSS